MNASVRLLRLGICAVQDPEEQALESPCKMVG